MKEIFRPREGVIAVDNGGFSTCVVTSSASKKFPSAKGEYRSRSLVSTHGPYDFIMEVDGRKYFGGTLSREAELPMLMHTKTKQHKFFDLSILTACHQWGYETNYVMTCVPIDMHNDEEKEGIRSRLCKEWTFTLNGNTKTFKIADVKVAPECVTAFWNKEPQGVSRWIDWGSRTINWGTTVNDNEKMEYIDIESGTLKKGLEALKTKDYETLVDYVVGVVSSKWDQDDLVYHVGGGISYHPEIFDYFHKFFPNSVVHDNPQMATAKGLYIMGRSVFNLA